MMKSMSETAGSKIYPLIERPKVCIKSIVMTPIYTTHTSSLRHLKFKNIFFIVQKLLFPPKLSNILGNISRAASALTSRGKEAAARLDNFAETHRSTHQFVQHSLGERQRHHNRSHLEHVQKPYRLVYGAKEAGTDRSATIDI